MGEMNYEKKMALLEAEKQRRDDLLKLQKGFQVADVFANRQYLDNFSNAEIRVLNEENIQAPQKLRIFRLTKIVFDKEEDINDKLTSVYNALYNLDVTVAMYIVGSGSSVSVYFATRSDKIAPLAGNILESTFRSNFPGVEFTQLDGVETKRFLNDIEKTNDGRSVAKGLCTVSMIPSIRNEDKKDQYIQGMEKFINTLRGKNYTAIFLATPLTSQEIKIRKHGFEELYSTLSPHAKLSYTYGENLSRAVSNGVTSSFTHSINESVTNSNGSSSSYSSSHTVGSSSGSSYNFSGDGFSWGGSDSTSSSSTSSYSSGTSFSHSISNSVGTSEADGTSKTVSDTVGSSESKTLNYENKGVSDLMKRIEEQLERISTCESYGLWESCAYFFSDDISASVLAATTYKSIMTGEHSGVENAHVNIWNGTEKSKCNVERIMDKVKHLVHPDAELLISDDYEKQYVTPTSLVSGTELSFLLGLPRKSVAGVAVQEMAEFGRAVVYENKIPERKISIGNIYHMGIEEEDMPVEMNLDLFSSHCFITGSSGSGKSYATYNLLDRLIENGVKILVIEPAKGEYKMVFGNLDKLNVFTTDANTYRLLRINPFQFSDHIHILSHIEQLLQIFNASWPLYAAMPAILKEAVVNAYVKCGWDILNSIWIEGICDHKYPVFEDVLETLPEIINTSDYSADSKGDYKGALLTRVQAMTTGINGMIFSKNEGIPDEVLFDQNTIIDLSEVGSEETIALIMGVMIMKLNEYRKSQRKSGLFVGHDADVSHVTVLEEAHNLLKRTSKDQNQEGANMVGKSVEMISNSIKEMRTYGEGFLIIDQSPLAVDSSVVENTATKIIMNTPSKDACDELGSALSLDENQIKELSRLNVGVAAVMQKGWMTPVLMKVGEWDPKKYEAELQYEQKGEVNYIRSCLVEELVNQIKEQKFSVKPMSDIIRHSNLNYDRKEELNELIEIYKRVKNAALVPSKENLGMVFMKIINCENLFSIIPQQGLYSNNSLSKKLDKLSAEKQQELKEAIIKSAEKWIRELSRAIEYYISVDQDVKKCAIEYMLYVKGNGGKDNESVFASLYNLLTWNVINILEG